MSNLLDRVDEVPTMSSLAGFEALLRGVEVHAWGIGRLFCAIGEYVQQPSDMIAQKALSTQPLYQHHRPFRRVLLIDVNVSNRILSLNVHDQPHRNIHHLAD